VSINLKTIFKTQLQLIDEGLRAKLTKGDTRDILQLVQSEMMLAERLNYMEEPEQDWPEGVSLDRIEQDDPDEKARTKKESEGGFYSR